MCHMRELVKVVGDDELATPWVAAAGAAGRRVVFIREGDRGVLDAFCRLGPGCCPVWLALSDLPLK